MKNRDWGVRSPVCTIRLYGVCAITGDRHGDISTVANGEKHHRPYTSPRHRPTADTAAGRTCHREPPAPSYTPDPLLTPWTWYPSLPPSADSELRDNPITGHRQHSAGHTHTADTPPGLPINRRHLHRGTAHRGSADRPGGGRTTDVTW